MPPPLSNPFKGLRPFSEEDTLFGRDADLTLMRARVFSGRTTLLFASQGVGKTSFLRAKLLPDLARYLDIVSFSEWATREDLLQKFGEAVARQLGMSGAFKSDDSSPDQSLLPPPLALLARHDSLRQESSAETAGASPRSTLLVFDQFEEVFQHHDYKQQFKAFIRQLCDIVNDAKLDVRVIFSMRDDFLGKLSVFDNGIPDLFGNYYRLKYPSREDARTIIERSVQSVGADVNEAGLDALIGDLCRIENVKLDAGEWRPATVDVEEREAERDFVVPPYLQIACHGLWEQNALAASGADAAGDSPPLFLQEYEPRGAQRTVSAFVHTQLDDTLEEGERRLVSEAFDFLVTRQGAKVNCELRSLADNMHETPFAVETALDKLAAPERRVLSTSHSPDGAKWYALYHDIYAPIVQEWQDKIRRTYRRPIAQRSQWSPAVRFDALLMKALREHSDPIGRRFTQPAHVATPRFLEACGAIVCQALRSRQVFIVELATSAETADYRDSVVSDVVFPPGRPRSQWLGRTASEIRHEANHWLHFIPSYSRSRVIAPSYALIALKLPVFEGHLDEVETHLAQAVKSIAGAVAVLDEVLTLRHSLRAVAQPNLLTRLADDYLGYELLRPAKTLGDWRSLSLWRSSQSIGGLQKLAEENADGSPLSAALARDGLITDILEGAGDECALICLEYDDDLGPSQRVRQLTAAVTGRPDVLLRSFHPKPVHSSRTQLRISVPARGAGRPDGGGLGYVDVPRVANAIEALCATILDNIRQGSPTNESSEVRQFEPGHIICLMPFVQERRQARPRTGADTAEANDPPFEAALVCHLGPGQIKPARMALMRARVDRTLVILAGLSNMHERVELWTEAVARLERTITYEQLYGTLEFLAAGLFDASAVVLWEHETGTATPRYFSPVLEGVDLSAPPEDLEIGGQNPLFFGIVHPNRQAWLTRAQNRLTQNARTRHPVRLTDGESISGFLVPLEIKDRKYLLVLLRDRISRGRQMDLALMSSLQSIIRQTLRRLQPDDETASRSTDAALFGKDHLLISDDEAMGNDICRLLVDLVGADSSLLLHADADADLLSTAGHVNGTQLAEEVGTMLRASGSFPSNCYSKDAAIWGDVSGKTVVIRRLNSDGATYGPAEKVPYLEWLPQARAAMALPLTVNRRKFGIAAVAWRRPLTASERAAAYVAMRAACSTVIAAISDRLLTGEARLRAELHGPLLALRHAEQPALMCASRDDTYLPPELDTLFPVSFRELLKAVLRKAIHELPCLSITVRLLDHFQSRLFLLAAEGQPGVTAIYDVNPPTSVSAYCVGHPEIGPISLPRIDRSKAPENPKYPGLRYDAARANTRSQLCLPLISRATGKPFGTLNFESDRQNGFHYVRGYCEELRNTLQELIGDRVTWSQGELLRHVTYMGLLFAQEHHHVKDLLTIAQNQLEDVSGNPRVHTEIGSVFAAQKAALIERIGALDSLHKNADFSPGEAVAEVARKIASTHGSTVNVKFSIPRIRDMASGNRWLFERAFESTLTQMVAFLKDNETKTGIRERRSIRVYVRKIPREQACIVALAHNGPGLRADLEDVLFWYQINTHSKGKGMGLALTGFEYRSMRMYPKASAVAPDLIDAPGPEWRTWFTVHIPLSHE